MNQCQCLYCGKTISYKPNRFPICSCGHTIPMSPTVPYGKLFLSQNKISIISEGTVRDIDLDNEKEIITEIVGLSFYNEKSMKKMLLAEMSDQKKQLSEYTVSEIILHSLYYNRSDIYKILFDKKISVAKALLIGKKYRCFQNSTQKYDFIYNRYFDHHWDSPEAFLIMLDCFLDGYPDYIKDVLINSHVSVDQYKVLIDKTQIDPNIIIKYLGELQSVSITGDEAIQYIVDYNVYSKATQQWFGMQYNDANPIYSNYYLAKLTYTMHRNTGLLNVRMYAANNDHVYSNYTINGYNVKMLDASEALGLPIGFFPREKVTAPIIGVYKSDVLISAIINCSGNIIIQGNQSDDVKQTINEFLDQIEN